VSNLAPLFSSEREDWQTPDIILERVRQIGPIALDPCTSIDNPTEAARWCVSPEDFAGAISGLGVAPSYLHEIGMYSDGLAQDWGALAEGGLVFWNPPYGRDILAWIHKARRAGDAGIESVGLLPARTDTKWFHAADPRRGCFLRGRLKFKGATAGAPFPSLLLYYGERSTLFQEAFSDLGVFI
jgi:hypothetical protein